jgi:hypothetical protein
MKTLGVHWDCVVPGSRTAKTDMRKIVRPPTTRVSGCSGSLMSWRNVITSATTANAATAVATT